ncbi:hypothetical protein GOP47_0025600 [Adiantum capillus-veneris]|uniref:Histidine kinase/HSP90-like ATPase domain-containing protein n=1 Tax=Adiantum capillus-veneris TaxID=13818 RepID=A0A9D4U315_ADICA|nr:hypothetical protein GOP47_0025600 [Adiantum capillus-veneris]
MATTLAAQLAPSLACSYDSPLPSASAKHPKVTLPFANSPVRKVSLARGFHVWKRFGVLDKQASSSLCSRITAVAADAVSQETQSADASEDTPAGERHTYQAEVSKLLDIIVHSLYSHTEVFLRELVSNSSDALDKLRFLSVTDPSLLENDPELAIKIRADKDQGILVIQDSGIGMTKEDLISSLGTIAQSGTANFLKALKENKETLGGDSGLIGRFGVGFYSAFLVAEKVVVTSKHPKSDKQYVWEAEANNNAFIIREETDPDYRLERGTAVILYIKEDAADYLDPSKIQDLVKTYSQFISFPIYVGREKPTAEKASTEERAEVEKAKKTYSYELVNDVKPIWLRSPKEITKEEYHSFYKTTYNERLDPMAYTHFNTEGEVEFKSLLYIPGMAPFSSDKASSELKNIKLYVKRVFISDDFHGELFPRYLSFIKGVVDSNDLPLNVSRELLQESRIVNLMKKRLTKKTFDLFDSIAKRKDKEDYKRFWRNYGKFIKLGISDDKDNQKRLASFLRYYSSKHQEEMTSLNDYVENMKEGQEAIYYFSSESVKSARNAPFMEKLVERGYEVLFLTEPMDEVSVNALKSFKGKDFVDISKEDFDLGDDEELDQLEDEFGPLCDWMKDKLGERISKVEVSRRLSTSPCALISGKHGWSANMERIMRAQNLGDTPGLREYMASTRILEINPKHRIIQYLDDARLAGKSGTGEIVDLLYETALMSSGFVPEDPAGFGYRIYDLMASMVGTKREDFGRGEQPQSNQPSQPYSDSAMDPEMDMYTSYDEYVGTGQYPGFAEYQASGEPPQVEYYDPNQPPQDMAQPSSSPPIEPEVM